MANTRLTDNVKSQANGRTAALAQIAERARRFPHFDPATAKPVSSDLPAQERTLAHAIEQAAARHWLTLVHLIEPHLRQPWEQLEPAMQAAILGGAAQLIYLDRVPDHAAISETVQWAKTTIRPGAGKMANAVLRRLAESCTGVQDDFDRTARDQLPLPDGGAARLACDAFPDDPLDRIAQQTGHRVWMIRRWAQQHGSAASINLALHDLLQPPVIITGDADANPPVAAVTAHERPHFFIVNDHSSLRDAPLGGSHAWRVQDPGTAEAVGLTRGLSPGVIVDYCAGRGTKTHQLLAMHPQSHVIATDVNDHRRADLRAAFAPVDRVTIVEPREIINHAGTAGLLVLDVPCSNSGVLARRVEARYRVREQDVDELVSAQRQVIADALPLLAPAGHLLYATCSIDETENQQQARWINHWHRMPIKAEVATMPRGLPGEQPSGYCDGGYAALLSGRE